MEMVIVGVVSAVVSLVLGYWAGKHYDRGNSGEQADEQGLLEFRVKDYINTQFRKVDNSLDDLDRRVNCLNKTDSALKSDHQEVSQHMSTILMVAEEVSEELVGLKASVEEQGDILDEVVDAVTNMMEKSDVLATGFNATVTSIGTLQDAQRVTRDLLDATINSFDWEDDGPLQGTTDPMSTATSQIARAYVPDEPVDTLNTGRKNPKMSNSGNTPEDFNPEVEDEALIVPPRQDGDPMITDLRAQPFEEAPADPNEPDPYALGPIDGIEEWSTGSGATDAQARARARAMRSRLMGR